jgi:hypothetical protein
MKAYNRKRKDTRFVKRFMVKIFSNGKSLWGVVNDLSRSGLLIKTNEVFSEEQKISIDLILPDSETAALTGVVKRIKKTTAESMNFSIGVELVETDAIYRRYLRRLMDQARPSKEELIFQS